MDALSILAVILGLIGIAGAIIPGLPGPPISWIGILLAYLSEGGMSPTCLWVWLAVAIVVTILDYVLPASFTKLTGGSKYASWGALIGLFVGMLFPLVPVGMLGGSILGAFLAEIVFANKDVGSSIVSALGAFAGFIFTTGMKLIVCGLMMYYIVTNIQW